MTTLAQMLLEDGFAPIENIPDRKDMADGIFAYLKEAMSSPSLDGCVLDMQRARSRPEHFGFDEDPRHAIDLQVQAKALNWATIMQSVQMPADRVWLEWRNHYSGDRVGHLVEVKGEKIFVISCIEAEDFGAAPYAATIFTCPPANDIYCANKYMHVKVLGNTPEVEDETMGIGFDVLAALFLITTPRVAEIRESEVGERKQRQRIKAGKLPLVEVRRVRLVVGVSAPRYKSNAPTAYGKRADGVEVYSGNESENEIRHRRLHRVIGHFRTYEKKQKAKGKPERVAWVPAHFRGDPELGMLLHERKVEQGGKHT